MYSNHLFRHGLQLLRLVDMSHSITFLGIDMDLLPNGDVKLSQRSFVKSLLVKHGMSNQKGNSSIQVDNLPDQQDIPTAGQLKELQGYGGEFNWLGTRTRTDVSYATSVLMSACTKFYKWTKDLAIKILRYLLVYQLTK